MRTSHGLTLAFVLIGVSAASAATVPFTEDYAASSANWRDSTGVTDLSWQAAGGPDGGSYASGTFNFAFSVEGDTPALLRGQQSYGSSGGAFVGNWLADGVSEFSMMVRHNAPEPLTFFTRFAGPGNFPGAIALEFIPVLPFTWTEVAFAIDPSNPEFITFEGSDFATVFSNIGNLQIGVFVSSTLAGVDAPYSFDLDKVSIVPEPAAGLALATLALLALRRRR